MKIYVINGFPQSGKSTFVRFCLDELGAWGKQVSTVDLIKDIAKSCGWNGEKTPKNRKFLSDLKDLLTEWNDIPYKRVLKEKRLYELPFEQVEIPTDDCFFFIHCREPEEIQKFVDGIGAKTILIQRESVDKLQQSNHADEDILKYRYDIIITNNGDLKELKDRAHKFLKKEGWKKKW